MRDSKTIARPSQTRWDQDQQVVVLSNGDHVAIGERVYGGGGYHQLAQVKTVAGAEAAALAERCVDNTGPRVDSLERRPGELDHRLDLAS